MERWLPGCDRLVSDPVDPTRRLLRTRCQRPRRCRAAKKLDELATTHVPLDPKRSTLRWSGEREIVPSRAQHCSGPMSEVGRSGPQPRANGMSALPPIADMQRPLRHVRKVPIAAVSNCRKIYNLCRPDLLDH